VGLFELSGSFKVIITRIQTLGRRSGKKFLVQYLKECVRILICFINHSQYVRQPGVPIVKIDKNGLPTLIPSDIRLILLKFISVGGFYNTLVLRCTLTMLSYFRVLQFKNLPNISSVTDGFTGISQSLELSEILFVSKWFPRFIYKDCEISIAESVGPNGPKGTWFAGADAIALILKPSLAWVWVQCAYTLKNRFLLAWFVVLIILVVPILPVLYLSKVTLPTSLGRLSTIREGGGKRRIVAITDWWTQSLLKPIHFSIMNLLKLIAQDGTYDQWKPIKEHVLPRLTLGYQAFSFDLSSATDRLPLTFQVQIMELLIPKFGRLWKALLDRDWIFQKKPVRYAVGQPIGAYSSWAILALSHHVIVQLAAARAGWTCWFPFYALLGDDIVIADKDVATHYMSIIRTLGVSINIQKSIISECGLIEFAKRWASPIHGELSAFPPGLLLGVWRSRLMVPMMILHLSNHGWLNFPKQLISSLEGLRSLLRIRPKLMSLMIATLLGPSGLLNYNQSHLTAIADKWFSMITGGLGGDSIGLIIRAYMHLALDHGAEIKDRADREMEYFLNHWFSNPILFGRYPTVAGILSIPLILTSPGFYVYIRALWKAVNTGLSASLNLAGLTGMAPPSAESIKFEIGDTKSLASINWRKKADVRAQFKETERLIKAISYEVQIDLTRVGTLMVLDPVSTASDKGVDETSGRE